MIARFFDEYSTKTTALRMKLKCIFIYLVDYKILQQSESARRRVK
jgi:hypothetical protein